MYKERYFTRREVLGMLGGFGASCLLGYPLIRKFYHQAKADNIDPNPDDVKESSSSSPIITKENTDTLSQAAPTVTINEATYSGEVKTGRDLIESLGLLGKTVYIIYGRPGGGWGTLGSSTTAEQTWNLANERRVQIGKAIGLSDDNFAYTVINPVYYFNNRSLGAIKDVYMGKALELASQSKGLVAPDFSDIDNAKKEIEDLEKQFPVQHLAHLSVSLDVEHFTSGGSLDASAINEFSKWFAEKHNLWIRQAGVNTPCFVYVYTFGKGKILNMGDLQQYYLDEKTLVVPVFDGYGTDGQKLSSMAVYVQKLQNTNDFPALVGVMEFHTKWGNRYDVVTSADTYKTLKGAPVYFFASQ